MASVPDERVTRLYALPPERFTAERNALAAALSSEGDREAAAAVKALRKPSAAAWAVNQLVRAEPELVEALLGAGGELRQAHRQAASGRGAEQLRAAAEAERAAVEQLMARAPAVLGRAPSAALGDSIRNTLHAASSGDEARERVRTGTLTIELRPIGLGPFPAGAAAAMPGDAGTKRRGTVRGEDAEAKRRAARAQDAEAKRRATELTQMLKAAVAAEKALRRELDAAGRALERAEDAYTRAREAVEAAAERAREARRRLRGARAGLADAEKRRSRLERES
jgi:hypothetical protein